MTDLTRRSLAFLGSVAAFTGRRRGVEVAVFVTLGAILEGAGIVLLVPLMATLFDASSGDPIGLAARFGAATSDGERTARLSLLLIAFAAVMAVRALVLWRRDTVLGRLQIGFIEHQRAVVAQGLASSRWETLARLGHGRVTHIMSGDIQRCGAGVYFLLQGGVSVVMIAVQAVLALALSPVLALIAISLLAVGAWALTRLFCDVSATGARVTASSLALMVGLGNFLAGLKMAMSQNLQRPFVQAFERELDGIAREQSRFISRQALMRGLWGLLGACVAGVTMLIGYGVLHQSGPVLIALLVVLARLAGPASQLQLGLQQIAYSLSAWEAVRGLESELGDIAPTPATTPASGPRIRMEGLITFENVIYRYGDGTQSGGVKDLTLAIQPGECVGVTGPSGSGKTTFADLLSGLVSPQSGRIAVGGVALDDAAASRWRDQVAYVAQDPVLFNDSVRANLQWACPTATDAEIGEVLRLTGVDRMTSAMPSGLDTRMGEGGALISGGERQRLALSRALLRKPDLLVLDEATSAIDIAGEKEILERLMALPSRPTVVLIAHRMESLALCDRVIHIEQGRLTRDDVPTARG